MQNPKVVQATTSTPAQKQNQTRLKVKSGLKAGCPPCCPNCALVSNHNQTRR
jgi:hypothetical protein